MTSEFRPEKAWSTCFRSLETPHKHPAALRQPCAMLRDTPGHMKRPRKLPSLQFCPHCTQMCEQRRLQMSHPQVKTSQLRPDIMKHRRALPVCLPAFQIHNTWEKDKMNGLLCSNSNSNSKPEWFLSSSRR